MKVNVELTVCVAGGMREPSTKSKPSEDTSDRVAIIDDTADSEFGHLGMRREQCIHALWRMFPTRCEVWHRFMTPEVLAADRNHDQQGDHHPRASAAIASASYRAIQARH